MTSAWQQRELWLKDGSWYVVVDRWRETPDDDEVLARFGHEALRRRELYDQGQVSLFDDAVPLVADMVMVKLVDAGWSVARNEGTSLVANRGLDHLELRSVGYGGLSLTGTVAGRSVIETGDSLGAMEDLLLSVGTGDPGIGS